jgi:Cdc6-like AAA superfamily ATPase
MQEVEARKAGKVFYIACERSLRNSLEELCRIHDLKIPRRAISASSVCEEVTKKYDAPRYVFILDEPEKVYKTAVSDIANFVHPLYNYMVSNKKNFNVIFVSRDTKLRANNYLPTDTLSRLRLQGIIFPRYTFPQITSILIQRLALALDNSQYDKAAVSMLSKHIYRIGGDMRQALQILRHAVFDLATDKLTTKVSEQAVEWGKLEWWKSQLTDRVPGPHWAFVTFIAAQLSKNNGDNKAFTVDQPAVMKTYAELCAEKDIHPLGTSSVYYIIDQISNRFGFFKQHLEKNGVHAQLIFEEHDREHILRAGKTINWTDAFAFEQPLQPTMSVS